jgi:hypothetical protein
MRRKAPVHGPKTLRDPLEIGAGKALQDQIPRDAGGRP